MNSGSRFPCSIGRLDAIDKITVFDESGTGNTPGDATNQHEFACCGIMVEPTQIAPLRRLHDDLARATGKEDFKFSDLRRSQIASETFVQGMAASKCDIITVYCAPGSVSAEQVRFEKLFAAQHGLPPGGATMQARTHHENLGHVLRTVATTFMVRTHERHRVYWDRRSDRDFLEAAWRTSIEEVRSFGLLPPNQQVPQVQFDPPRNLRFLVRIAGAVAGDMIAFFRRCGPRLYTLVRPQFVVERPLGKVIGHLKVADGAGKLIRPGVDDIGDQRTLLRWYYRRLLNRQIFFYDPQGRGCGVKILRNGRWEIHQVPDRVEAL